MSNVGKKFIITGVLLITISISLFIYNKFEEINAGIKSQESLSIFKENIKDNNLTLKEQKTEMQTMMIDGYNYIGTITIPNINLELPIMDSYDYDRLKIAPCRYYGSLYTNDLIICGHSYKTHFGNLVNLKQGDLVIFKDVNGMDYYYEVLEIEILSSKDVSKMINNEFDLTLYTCTKDRVNRVTIRCNRVYLD